MKNIIIYGAGMLGQQVANMLQTHFSSQYKLMGCVDDTQDAGIRVVDGLTTIGSLETVAACELYNPRQTTMIFAIGYTKMQARGAAFKRAVDAGYTFQSIIHPHAVVDPGVILGDSTIVLAGSVIDQFVTIGSACYIHIGSKIGEGCTVGDNNYFSAGTTLGGSVDIGHDNFFGINATVVNDVSIGSKNFINAGSLIYKDMADETQIAEYREQREIRYSE